jgi:transposase
MKDVLFVAIDVDDNQFHACGVRVARGKTLKEAAFQFRCKPDSGVLARKLKTFAKGAELKICYEATYLGFSLYRDLKKRGFQCEVIAPSLIPRVPGKQVKTDRIDSEQLARFYSQGLLTSVQVPSTEEEQVRDLVRSRSFLKDQVKGLKNHISSMCKRISLNYRIETGSVSYWTTAHWAWLKARANTQPDCRKFNLSLLISQLEQSEATIRYYNEEILRLSKTEEYSKRVKALCCYRGVDTLSAMAVVTELGDIRRFDHPTRLASYAGMDLQEYSSGGKERRYHITKMGSRHLRTAAVECTQQPWSKPNIGVALKKRRAGIQAEYVQVADRCMKRLHKKSSTMLYTGKTKNKIKVACAREFLCFVWESLRLAA